MICWNQFGKLGCKLKRRGTLPTSLFLAEQIGISGDKVVIFFKAAQKPDVSTNWGKYVQIWKKKELKKSCKDLVLIKLLVWRENNGSLWNSDLLLSDWMQSCWKCFQMTYKNLLSKQLRGCKLSGHLWKSGAANVCVRLAHPSADNHILACLLHLVS